MKPRNKAEAKVVELSSQLPKWTKDQRDWSRSLFDNYVTFKWKSHFCLECNHKWRENEVTTRITKGITCPNCNAELKVSRNFTGHIESNKYYAVITTFKGYQIVRMYNVTKRMSIKDKPEYIYIEVMQHWIDSKGKLITLMERSNSTNYYFDKWLHYEELEVRTNSQWFKYKQSIFPHGIYPKRNILPILKRNGFKYSFHDMNPYKVFKTLLSDHKGETLWKAERYDLFRTLIDGFVKREEDWKTYKIVLRHNYEISDVKTWLDYLTILKRLNKDLTSPKYVCPDNLTEAHNKYLRIWNRRENKKKIALLKEKIKEEQLKYIEAKKKFLKLKFKQDNIVIKPLRNIEEFIEEGSDLNHCVFASEYYKKENSLILSAKVNGKRTETIEVSLDKFTIEQARGNHNHESKYHNQIIELVKSNINQIKQIA